jgi:hypothetical protein
MMIDLTGWNGTEKTLFDCDNNTFTGFESMKSVTLGGEKATYSAALAGYASTNYKLILNGTQMQLSSVLA